MSKRVTTITHVDIQIWWLLLRLRYELSIPIIYVMVKYHLFGAVDTRHVSNISHCHAKIIQPPNNGPNVMQRK